MYFTKIELYNYGIYKGLHCIYLQNQQENRNITLIGGMNGRGKTTILDAIFLCLYGRKAVEYVAGKKEAYSKLLEDHINKSALDQSAHIALEVVTDEASENKLLIRRAWKRSGEKIDTSMKVIHNGCEDEYLSQNWEYYVEELIPFGIAKFFFFDNEKISQIADDESFDKVKDSIKSVMGVTTIESLIAHLGKIARAKSDEVKAFQSSEKQAEIDALQSQLDSTENEIRNVKLKRAQMTPLLEKVIADLESKEAEFWKCGGNLGLKKKEIEAEKDRILEEENETKQKSLELSSTQATPLCLCKSLVVAAYNNAKNAEHNMAKQYSTPILLALHTELVKHCKDAFGSENFYGVLMQIIDAQFDAYKPDSVNSDVAELSPMSLSMMEKFVNDQYQQIINLAKTLRRKCEANENELLQLDVHLNSTADEAGSVEMLAEIRDMEAQKGSLTTRIEKCDEELHELENKRKLLDDQQQQIRIKLAVQADSNDDNARILQYATLSIDVMKDFINQLQAQKVHKLEQNISHCFNRLAQKQAIITSITIDPVTLDIVLRDYEGGLLLKDQLSAGEKQMFAISILWGLALTSGYKLPVIIDTPMARLDSAHRTNFINRYLPNASTQVVVLSTDEEVYGQYLTDIKSYVNASYTLVYDEKEKCSSIRRGYFGGELQ